MTEDSLDPLDYVEARKQIFVKLYNQLVVKEKQFWELKERHQQGENLVIIDGPHQESLPYYQESYGVNNDFIENNTIVATRENLEIMFNDTKHFFSHGYALAAILQDIYLS